MGNENEERYMRKISGLMEGMRNLSSFKDLSREELVSVNAIFNSLRNYPTFTSFDEFIEFIIHQKEKIEDLVRFTRENSRIYDLADKGLLLGGHYMHPQDSNFRFGQLNQVIQRQFIETCALSTPEERKEIEQIARQYRIKLEKGHFEDEVLGIIS